MENGVDFRFYILHGKEERYLEYKRSMIWTGNYTTKVKIAKAMMAMANLRNGGVVVVGMQETTRGVWIPEGMTAQQIASFTQDDVAQWINDYATPAIQFSIQPFALNDNEFIVIQVQEFDTSPVICRKQRNAGGETLEVGAIYYRSNRKIEQLGFYWYEDPLPEDDIYNYVKLRQKLDIPILATEYTQGGLYGLTQFILQGATDMLRGDVRVKGGITALVKICHLAEAFRMKCEIHHGGNSLNNVANLHVTMAVNNCEYFEVLLPAAAQKYGLVNDIEVDNQGLVHASEEPGLGYEIDWELVKSKTTRVLR